MKNRDVMKAVAVVALGIGTVIFAVWDNEMIFPSTLVGFCLFLTTFGNKRSDQTPSGKAAHYAIVSFSILVIVLNIGVSIFLPRLAASSELMHYYSEQTTDNKAKNDAELDDHFVDVTINDMHELCYTTSVLLLLNGVFLLFLTKKRGIYRPEITRREA